MDTTAYAEAYARDYVGPMFYYCLKKTGDRNEAEELASDIALAVLHALANYPPPARFSAWVWKIAHNRYARWVESRSRHRERIAGEDIGEFDIADGDTPEDMLIESEQYSLLRRELAFIAKEHRELIAAHYIENVGISELSRRLDMPTGTVKTRLMRARKILKEGMNMAREFGKRSYAPEDVSFAASGNQPDGLPWSAVYRMIPKNILLEAANNPSTAEELAMELGIALPYMEEEIDILKEATLLTQLDDGRYITGFFIADRDCQVEIHNAERRESVTCTRLFCEAFADKYEEIKALLSPTVDENTFKWTLISYIIDKLVTSTKGFAVRGIFKRPHGGDWGFGGYEQHDLIAENTFINHNVAECGDLQFGQYAAFNFGFKVYDCMTFDISHLVALAELVKSRRSISTLNATECKLWDTLSKRYAHEGADGYAVADIVVFRDGAEKQVMELMRSHPAIGELEKMLEALFCEVREILKRSSNAVLHETLDYYVSMFMCDVRGMIINDAVANGTLTVPENPETSNAGMYIIIK